MNHGVWQRWRNVEYGYGLVQWTKAMLKFLAHIKLEPWQVDEMATNDPKALMDAQLSYLVLTMKNGTEWLPNSAQSYYNI